MDQFARARLRDPCNETVTCIGNYVLCHIQGSTPYCRCADGYAPNPEEPQSCTEMKTIDYDIGPDPTMIGVVIGLALMSVTLCVVMRLFAKARFAENRTIFNTANPRLMNVSLKTTGGSGRTSGMADANKNNAASERERFNIDAPPSQESGASSGLMNKNPTSPV